MDCIAVFVLFIIFIVIVRALIYFLWELSDDEKKRCNQEELVKKEREAKHIALLPVIYCKTCGAPVHATQRCAYCKHQN